MPYPFDLLAATADAGWRSAEMRLVRAAGAAWIATLAKQRFEALVAVARERSPFYRERYRDVPVGAPITAYPPVRRAELMARFDEWATDARVRRDAVERHLADPHRATRPFLGECTVWTSSGTTGEPGIFVQDEHAMGIYDALVATQVDAQRFGARQLARWSQARGRAALVVATGGAYPAIAAWQRLARLNPALAGRVYPITQPLPKLVAALTADAPAFLSTYPTLATLLALEQEARRLAIAPVSVWCGGEALFASARARIAAAFDCAVHEEYGAAECFAIAGACPRGALHYHADWVLLEPVDADGRAVPPACDSHSVLVTNLANRLQPIIRYDLGDSLRVSAQPCPCGSPLPVIAIRGRCDDVLALRDAGGGTVAIVPLAIESVIESVLGPVPFQVEARDARVLHVRLAHAGAHAPLPRARQACLRALSDFLAAQGLANVRVVADPAPPTIDARSGKLRRVFVSRTRNAAPRRTRRGAPPAAR